MKRKKIYLGDTFLDCTPAKVKGGFVEMEGEKFYKITNYHQMPDFLMTIVSDSDHWNFISSNGSLSAGRKDRNNALFPYYTDDKIHDYYDRTGSKTILFVSEARRSYLWEPFSKEHSSIYKIERNLYKSIYGNKLIFEEINDDLEISFKYGWYSSELYGFVKKSVITNRSSKSLKVEILDGLQNILPHGVFYEFQNEYSNLLDGYKKNELIEKTGLGLFMLSSIPVDRAEPSESLNATTVWSQGLKDSKILISANQLDDYKCGLPVQTETDVRAARGAYFVHAELNLEPNQDRDWLFVAEINQNTTDVANLNKFLKGQVNHTKLVNADIKKGTTNLIKIVSGADGLQSSHEELCSARHFTNTLFNVMRGGIYLNNYIVEGNDFRKFVEQTNKNISLELAATLISLPAEISDKDLIDLAYKTGNPDFIRICYEYLPLTFSRRHGDPSRPWNQFSIETKNEDGSPKSDYQGNWRDIFQNWEALSLSYPGYIENIISKFVNASTPDGYNPYRIKRDGIDWESPEPDDPWAYIGYWGDHQVIYLQKLLELSEAYHPGKLDKLLTKEIFAYANVPYRIKSYQEIVKNPQATIDFDGDLNNRIKELVKEIGADGRLVRKGDETLHVNLTEKVLVSLLAKLSNFIPEAGIWLNTQRPEWNDANNALVGNGVSMVTLYYLRRALQFWIDKFSSTEVKTISISEEVKTLFDAIYKLFADNTILLEMGFSDEKRRYFADVLGEAGSNYRNSIYKNSFSGKKSTVNARELVAFTKVALEYIDQSIRVNKGEDGLYQAYNLISFKWNGISIRHLYVMLEGQVAVLSSGLLSAKESLDVLDHLKWSPLFRQDQYSYLLYPDRQLPRFNERNNIPTDKVEGSKLLKKLIADNNSSILSADNSGHCHFDGSFRNANVLETALDQLDSKNYGSLVQEEKAKVLDIYEEMFDHQSFTGRSGTFYGYEGLGSIYWHMVGKLLLATEECFFKAVDEDADPLIIGKLKDHFYEIKAGIGLYKSPKLYGAFPTDAYSHTPGNAGAKQPGMTGQVKEDVISRMGEIGVRIIKGEILFDLTLINKKEFLLKEQVFEYVSLDGKIQQLSLQKKQLGFTLCQVPVVYTLADQEKIVVVYTDNRRDEIAGNKLEKKISSLVFNRTNEIALIEVSIIQ
ncbi:MAG: hypothetical protein K9H64_00390 [Bacteroidales bacterium]|nr:hypothetical protein [Bacteroidales bacterium]MCF8454352.1 hypothetical protein [Bacteroidales bacterium]